MNGYDIRNQIHYWKNRRNDCAHSKVNIIDACHVEAFWTFLQSNLSKITVEGGKQTLLTKIERHYNINLTPKDADVQPLIKEIATAVTNDELNDFWNECAERISGECWSFSDRDVACFFDTVIPNYADNQFSYIKDSLLSFISVGHLCDFLSECPHRIIDFCSDQQEIRNFWMQKLKHCRGPLNIYAVTHEPEGAPRVNQRTGGNTGTPILNWCSPLAHSVSTSSRNKILLRRCQRCH